MRLINFFLTITLIKKCTAYNIFYLAGLPNGSHRILGDALVNILVDAGHEVTYASAMTKMSSSSKVKVIHLKDNINVFPEGLLNITSIMDKLSDMTQDDYFFPIIDKLSLVTLQNEEVQKILNDQSLRFDAVIAEWMYNEMYAGVATVFDCPLIWFSSLEPHWLVLRAIDEAPNPAYNPDSMSANVFPFTFSQRVEELWLQISRSFYREFWTYTDVTKIYYDIYTPILSKRGKAVPSYEEVRYNGSLMLGNSHAILGQPTRLPQNYRIIGGYHIDRNVKPLPENLQRIMDGAKHGVIYFSMGSNLKSEDYPPQIKQGLLKLFGGLKQTVIWKFESDLNNVPKNVHTVKWAPQQSILAHPNCVLFVTHCGLLSTTEAINFGVPIVGIPVFIDQFETAARAVRKGYGKQVNLSYKLAEELKVAIEEVTSNSRYREKAQELSKIYHDRPITPQQEIVYSVEHVIRTKGANYLRSPALMIPFYQKMYLDLLAIIFVALISFGIIVNRLLKIILNRDKKKVD